MPEDDVNQDPEFLKLMQIIGAFIRRERIKRGHKGAETFANTIDVNRSTMNKYENGREDMRFSTFFKIYNRGLHKTTEDIFKEIITGAEKDPNPEEFQISHEHELQVRHQVENILGQPISVGLSVDDINRLYLLLTYTRNRKLKKNELRTKFNLAFSTRNFNKMLKLAVDAGWVSMTHPDRPNHKDQRYYTTEAGIGVLNLKA